MKSLLTVLVLAAVASGAYYYFARPQAVPQPPDLPPPSPSASLNPENAVIVSVEAGSFYYNPNTITVKKGQQVTINLTSVSMMHDFVIDELNVRMPIIKNGDADTVEFTPTQTGEFEYYCSVADHRAKGQVGKLIVTE